MPDGRKANGGVRPNSGRRSKAEEMGLPRLLEKCWTQEQREEVIEALHAQAVNGNIPAAQLLLSYAYGKPTEKHEVNAGGSITLKVVYD